MFDLSSADHAHRIDGFVRDGSSFRLDAIHPFFQPIENIQTGEIMGFEALARLFVEDEVLCPGQFLAALSEDELLALFCAMLGESIVFSRAMRVSHPHLYVAVNVETFLLLRPGFCDTVSATLARYGFAGERIVLEILERHQIEDFNRLSGILNRIRALGLSIALDDIGSAYSALINLKRLPIDIIKLDCSFARGLPERPEDLYFILSIASLARGLGKTLVVEGAETADIHDALRVLGVEYVQGYAIARPMPKGSVMPWLASRAASPPKDRMPRSMLGAYAGHLTVVETCKILMNQPLPVTWKEESKDPHACAIGKFFDLNKTHDTAYGLAHKRFHEVMALYDTDIGLWTEGADAFRIALETELVTIARSRFHCEPVTDGHMRRSG